MQEDNNFQTYVTNKHYDITGQEVLRILKHSLISKFSRYEDLGGGPGYKCLLGLYILHYLSRPGEWLLDRFEAKIRYKFNR